MNKIRNVDLLEKFGLHIRSLRTKKKMTMESFSYACDIELSQVYRIEKGKVNVTLSTLHALSKGLEITLQQLLKDFDTTELE